MSGIQIRVSGRKSGEMIATAILMSERIMSVSTGKSGRKASGTIVRSETKVNGTGNSMGMTVTEA
jgi:hypothetical protein